MDIYAYLQKDHRLVSQLMEKLLETEDNKRRETIFDQIKQELTLHADTEEVTFYKAVEEATRNKNVQEQMEHANLEHTEIREYLETLDSSPVGTEEWMKQFREFKHAVIHHVEEEEGKIFEKARKYLSKDEAVTLARNMEALKQKQKKGLAAA
jgi:hemerythrin superfamily protein